MWNPPTEQDLKDIPKLYETEDIPLEEKIIHLHFFIAGCDWYVAEYDGEDLFFGFAIINNDLGCAEWGYVSFEELRDLAVGFVQVDRDLYWKVRPAKEVSRICEAQGWNTGESANAEETTPN